MARNTESSKFPTARETWRSSSRVSDGRSSLHPPPVHSFGAPARASPSDPDRKELLGNYPQAFSHVGLINAAWRLTETAEQDRKDNS